MPGTSQPDPEEGFPASKDVPFPADEGSLTAGDESLADDSSSVEEAPTDGSLTGAEVAALAAADRAEDAGWLMGGAGAGAGGAGAGAGADAGVLELAGGGCGVGFAEGEVLDGAVPSVLLAGLAEEAYRGRGGLDDDRLAGVLRAYRRLGAQMQARELGLIAELARRRPQPGTAAADAGGGLPGRVSEFLGDEVAVLLTLTSRAAGRQVGLALGLAARRRTAAALEAGRIDLPKALVLLELLEPAEEVTAAAVEAAVLPIAPGLTTAELRAWVIRLLLDLDPAVARRRREAAQRQAHVACWQDPEGTATLAGRYLPPAQVLAADRRLCAIATAWKKQGAVGGMDLLRAHAYLALLLGHDPATPPQALLSPPPDPNTDPDPATDPDARPGPDSEATRDSRPGPGPKATRDSRPGPGPKATRDSWPGPDSGAARDTKRGQASAPEPATARDTNRAPTSAQEPAATQDPDLATTPHPASATAQGPAPAQNPARTPDTSRAAGGPVAERPPLWLTGTVNLTVPMATLLELADRPGEAAGFGPLHADTARDLASGMSAHPATRWNVIITDPNGRAMAFGGPARARRPKAATTRGDPAAPCLARGSPAATTARGSPAATTARGSPIPFGAGGWTITLTTEPIAPYY